MSAINQSASRTLNGASQQDIIISFRGQISSFLVLATIICLSFAIRAYPLSHSGINWALDPDSTGYLRLADGIRTGCGFAARWHDGSCGPAELQRTPGYPLFLVSLHNLRLVVMAQAGLGAAVCMLVALFCWFQWGSAAGIIAASISAFDLSSVISNNIGTEILFTFLVTTAILLLLILIQRAILDIWCIVGLFSVGCFLGAAELVRPIGQVLLVVPFFSVVLATKSSLAKRVALLLFTLSVPVAVIAGWSYRNYEQRGCWVFSSIGAVNLYYYRAAGVLARETHRSVDEVKFDFLSSAGRASRGSDLWSQTLDEDPSEMRRYGIRILASHPLDVALMTFKAFARGCLLPSNRPALSNLLGHRADQKESNEFITTNVLSDLGALYRSPWLAAIRSILFLQLALTIFTWIGVGMALTRIFGQPSPLRSLILIPLTASVLLLAAAAGPEMNDRFRVPATPMLALVAAFGWTAGKMSSAGPKN